MIAAAATTAAANAATTAGVTAAATAAGSPHTLSSPSGQGQPGMLEGISPGFLQQSNLHTNRQTGQHDKVQRRSCLACMHVAQATTRHKTRALLAGAPANMCDKCPPPPHAYGRGGNTPRIEPAPDVHMHVEQATTRHRLSCVRCWVAGVTTSVSHACMWHAGDN